MLSLVLVGISHHQAPVELRERVALDHEHAQALAAQLACEGREAVCVSTCNRTEVYLVAEDGQQAELDAVEALVALEPQVEPVLYRRRDRAAAQHLFRVAAGLESLVPGEGEILGQLRLAQGTASPILGRVFRHAVHVGGKVRARTAIGENPASVSAAAVALAAQIFGDLEGRSVLLLGAGHVSGQAARNLRSRGAEIALVAKSTTEPERIEEQLRAVDVVIASTNAPGLVLAAASVAKALAHRHRRPLLLVDLAVPRDLDPAIAELGDCYLYDIDDLERIVAETMSLRRGEAQRAEVIVAAEVEKFEEWYASLAVVPVISSLRARADEIRRSRLRNSEALLGRLDEGQRRVVDTITAQILNEFLHLPTVRMKQAAAGTDDPRYVEAITHLFGLCEEAP